MKKMMFLAMMMTIAISASAMTYTQARNEALFLSDKMAYELKLTNSQFDAVYEINLDYLMAVNRQTDISGYSWTRRDNDMRHVLSAYQYRVFKTTSYFYRPLSWKNGNWYVNVYSNYSNHGKMYHARPNNYYSYKGGNNKKGHNYYADRGVVKPNDHPSNGNGSFSTHGHVDRIPNSPAGLMAHSGNNRNNNGHFGNRR